MPVIKRYPNRKLYDTEAKQYITLEALAALIREGEEIQVVDHTTGEDLTAVTLSQIIFEQEKRLSGFLPQAVLTGLIRAGGETLGVLRRTLASPLDLARQVDDEIERRVQVLTMRGELAAEEGLRLRDMLLSRSRRSANPVVLTDEQIEKLLAERGVPSTADLQQVLVKLEMLEAKLDGLNPPTRPELPSAAASPGLDQPQARTAF
jgi:polyhydroxyalkanoate synthesis repressor PhaR